VAPRAGSRLALWPPALFLLAPWSTAPGRA